VNKSNKILNFSFYNEFKKKMAAAEKKTNRLIKRLNLGKKGAIKRNFYGPFESNQLAPTARFLSPMNSPTTLFV
jgi:hypothetical protein